MSDITASKKKKKNILLAISWALNLVPMLVFFFISFGQSSADGKIALGLGAIMALVVGGFGIFTKCKIKRTIFWILAIVIYQTIGDYSYLIVTIAACQCIDEIVIVPMLDSTRESYKVNKEIDKRMEK